MELDWLKKWNLYSPEKIAIKDGDTNQQYSYGEFYKLALQASFYLKEKYELQPGDRVAVLSTNELEYVILFFALQRIGAILVPVNFRLTEREITHIMTVRRLGPLQQNVDHVRVQAVLAFIDS